MARQSNAGTCITPHCGREVAPAGKGRGSRGLCKNCYWSARKRIRDGEITDKQLVDMGLMLPSRGPAPTAPGESPFAKAVKAGLEAQS